MQLLFKYNWQIRQEWFNWCESFSTEELLQVRNGGLGIPLKTLFHIIDVEYSWIRALKGAPDLLPDFEDYKTLGLLKELSGLYHSEVSDYLSEWTSDMETKIVKSAGGNDYTFGEVLRHLIAHEIHHVGQLSIWAKELGKQAVSANYIGRGLI
ncbi:damage-inducible protein DinB [Paenibacillus sp. LMG 31456]|uniref:Damage-inducible protein DinB n=1 Tax=Paenibacillus foliorum TaxID=2654974 RepID=A0A972GZT3_9BACL|nr:DinB family protein [Paenibacillus foliorum]NOU93586.1 damage-inducible protein DinB [Paenibacillus foliorum]